MAQEATDIDLTGRVQRLEREIRVWRAGVAIILVSAVLLFLLFPTGRNNTPEIDPFLRVVEAGKLVLRDRNNRIRAVLGAEYGGSLGWPR